MRVNECHRFLSRFLFVILILGFGTFISSCSSQAKENHIKRGEEFLEKRKFQEAVMEFRAAADIDEESGEARWGLARSYEHLDQFVDTVQELRKVVELLPDNLDAKVKLGNYLLVFSPPQIDETAKILEDVFKRDPNFIEGHILKASMLSVQGKPEPEVLEVLNYAISLDPKRTESYVSLSRFYGKNEKNAEAEEALKKGISVNPARAIGYIEYARFLSQSSRFPEAEQQFRKAIEAEPKNIEAHDSLAQFYVAQKQFDKAEVAYKELVTIEENSPESRMALGNFYGEINRDADAVEVYRSIISENPEYVRARHKLGEIYLDRKEPDLVQEQLDKLFEINDRDAEALILRVRLNLFQNKTEEAVADLEEILKKNPNQKDALFYMTQAKINLGQIEQARAFIGDLSKYHPEFLRVNLLKIQASLSAGESDLALRQANELLQTVSATEPSRENSAESIADLKIRALTARGLANLQLGNIAVAQKDLSDVANFTPNSASALVNLAKIHVAERNLDEALSLYERALVIDQSNFDAVSGMVSVLLRQNRSADAHSRVDLSIRQNSRFAIILPALNYLKADVFMAEGKLNEAEAALKKTIELDENYLPAYSSYAALLIERGQTDAALAQFKNVVDRKPSAAVYTLIGILEESRTNKPDAEKNYRKALEIEPNSPIAANNLAWMLASDKTNLDEALKLAQSTVSQDPNNAGFYDTLGWVYYQKGLESSAVEHFRKAVSLDAAAAARGGVSPNPEYRERLTLAINAIGKPAA
ncbi:MAG: tetratricopeptide repeat protein [Pyrinomonadaceae bacterium]|nr:tetratricopeptide repeat protein [Pyrinomonadaceae bacterium]